MVEAIVVKGLKNLFKCLFCTVISKNSDGKLWLYFDPNGVLMNQTTEFFLTDHSNGFSSFLKSFDQYEFGPFFKREKRITFFLHRMTLKKRTQNIADFHATEKYSNSIIKAWAIILKMVKYELNQHISAYYGLNTTNGLITYIN